MSAVVTSTSEHRAAAGKPVDKGALAEWLQALPPGASLDALFREEGGQRDSYRVFTGLKATWQTVL